MASTIRVTFVAVAVVLLFSACDNRKTEPLPTFQDTIDYMQRSLSSHNGQRIQQPPLSAEVKLVTHLTVDHCKLTYELSQFDVVQFDLSDIDTKTVTVKQIGNSWWVVFKTRDFNKSVQYKHPKDPGADYNAESGGFSLDAEQTANSFAKAITHAVELCGGKPSSF